VDAIGKFQFQGHFQGNQGDNRSILWGVVDFFGSSDFAPTGPVDPKFQVEWVTPTNHSSSRITRLNALSYGIKILTDLFFLFVTMHAFDRQTDGQTDRQTGNFLLRCNRMSALVAPSGKCLRDESLVWLIGAMVYSLAAYSGSNCSLACAMDGRI